MKEMNGATQPMKRHQFAFAVILAYLWLTMVLLGANIFETFIIYPNIFHNVPQSLDTAMAFMTVRGPADFFPLIGGMALLTGIGAVLLSWNVTAVRYWFVGSVVIVIVGQFLLSVAFFWPRNTIMFVEGPAVHSAATLQQTAREFQTGHWVRLAMSAVAPAVAFVGFLKFYRHRITAKE